MLMKASDLTGAALDYAVAQCEGATNLRENPHRFDKRLILTLAERLVFMEELRYSTDWGQGGPIIEREKITLDYDFEGQGLCLWAARKYAFDGTLLWAEYGPTPLIAAMRCYVASRLGDTVEIPDEIGAK